MHLLQKIKSTFILLSYDYNIKDEITNFEETHA